MKIETDTQIHTSLSLTSVSFELTVSLESEYWQKRRKMSDEDGEPTECLLLPTDLLYMTYEGNFQTKCSSKVMAVHREIDSCSVQVVLDQTILHAQGGGQPTDYGKLAASDGQEIAVTKVLVDRDTGIATHTGEVSERNSGLTFSVGDTVQVTVDETRRRILSECHTAGHVVDSAMTRCGKFLKPSKAYHFLDAPYVEYEGSVPPEEREELLRNLQTAFCQLIQEDIPTTIELMSKNDAHALCNRQRNIFNLDLFADKQTELIRVVTVAGFPCPCGGKFTLQ
jgi:Ser-tRNA(Ala) deacylase AlaX